MNLESHCQILGSSLWCRDHKDNIHTNTSEETARHSSKKVGSLGKAPRNAHPNFQRSVGTSPKGPAERGHVKKTKIVKKRQDTFQKLSCREDNNNHNNHHKVSGQLSTACDSFRVAPIFRPLREAPIVVYHSIISKLQL